MSPLTDHRNSVNRSEIRVSFERTVTVIEATYARLAEEIVASEADKRPYTECR